MGKAGRKTQHLCLRSTNTDLIRSRMSGSPKIRERCSLRCVSALLSAMVVVGPLPAVVALCKRQRFGEFIGRHGAKGGAPVMAPAYAAGRERSRNGFRTRRHPGNQPDRCRIIDAVGLPAGHHTVQPCPLLPPSA